MKVLFVGNLDGPHQTSWQRMDTLRTLGVDVVGLNQSKLGSLTQRRILRRIDGEPFLERNVVALNTAIVAVAEEAKCEVAWIDKGLMVERDTLQSLRGKLPGVRLICYQDDNPFGARRHEHSFWRRFIDCIPEYDLHFVKRPQDVRRFSEKGAKAAVQCLGGFYEPQFVQSKSYAGGQWMHDICFIGTAIDDRSAVLGRLILLKKLRIDIYGDRWNRCFAYYLRRRLFHGYIDPGSYCATIARSRINLGFVSWSNEDEFNGRSYDIPAAGGFLLAERTAAHVEMYREDKEAVFFANTDELVAKCKFYLRHERERLRIAEAGKNRAWRGGYSLSNRLQNALKIVSSL